METLVLEQNLTVIGETEYKWDEGASSAQPQDEAAPRQQAEIDIQHGLDDLSLSDTPDSGYGYAYGSQAGSSHGESAGRVLLLG